MNFSELLQGTGAAAEGANPAVAGLDYDSRRIQPGWLFVAMRGESTDGNRYIDAALKKGAVAVVTDSREELPRPGIPWVVVPHGRKAMATLSSNFYGRPSERLKITGITGTNGKSTTSFLIESILNHCGKRTALIGTIEYHVAGKVLPAPHTTPESLELNRLFAEALQAGATDVVMEVSSHALQQGRVWGIPYEVAVFTNLTRDHLDYHKDMESYYAAKAMLFQGCGTRPPRESVINADDAYGQALARLVTDQSGGTASKVVTYGTKDGDEFHCSDLDLEPQGSNFIIHAGGATARLQTALIGQINVYNILAAAAAARARGCALAQIAGAVKLFQQVPGRFERVDCGQPFTVVVDYAHTDDALANLTAIARDFVRRGECKGRVITVFGCGGDRDRMKRPLMGEAVGKGSDFVVLTSDNPRSEDPERIIADALPGLERTGTPHAVEVERRQAIRLALTKASPGDMLLIAGKGHEKFQVTREGTFPFDDVQVAKYELEQMGYLACVEGEGGR